MVKVAKTKIKQHGSTYSHCVYLPSRLVQDSTFPFTKNDFLVIEIKKGCLVIKNDKSNKSVGV